jgi:phosphatidylglycerophosphate synthase
MTIATKAVQHRERDLPAPEAATAPSSGPAFDRARRLANVTSVIGMVLCVSAGIVLAAHGSLAPAGVLFALGGICDIFDGYFARKVPQPSSPGGAFLDSMCDKIGEAAVFVGLLVALDDSQAELLLSLAYAVGSVSSYAKSSAVEHGLKLTWGEVRYFGRAGRVVILAATIILADAILDPSTWLRGGFTVLLAFNVAALAWRVGRVFLTTFRHHIGATSPQPQRLEVLPASSVRRSAAARR